MVSSYHQTVVSCSSVVSSRNFGREMWQVYSHCHSIVSIQLCCFKRMMIGSESFPHHISAAQPLLHFRSCEQYFQRAVIIDGDGDSFESFRESLQSMSQHLIASIDLRSFFSLAIYLPTSEHFWRAKQSNCMMVSESCQGFLLVWIRGLWRVLPLYRSLQACFPAAVCFRIAYIAHAHVAVW